MSLYEVDSLSSVPSLSTAVLNAVISLSRIGLIATKWEFLMVKSSLVCNLLLTTAAAEAAVPIAQAGAAAIYGASTTAGMVVLAVVVAGIATIPASISSNNAFALDTLCPPHHQCHCIVATGVYYDFNPEEGRMSSINASCTNDNR